MASLGVLVVPAPDRTDASPGCGPAHTAMTALLLNGMHTAFRDAHDEPSRQPALAQPEQHGTAAAVGPRNSGSQTHRTVTTETQHNSEVQAAPPNCPNEQHDSTHVQGSTQVQ